MLHTLADMTRLVELLASPGPQGAASVLADRAVAFFNSQARAHHEAEETRVFPSLLAGGDSHLLAHVRRLQQDHMWLEEDWLELEPHLLAVARGFRGEHVEFLSTALPEFMAICRDHIALEETLIYPEARRRDLALKAATTAAS